MLASPRFNRLPAAERGITIGDFLVPIRVGDRMSSRARHVALVIAGALFVFLTAQISIRLPGTPIPGICIPVRSIIIVFAMSTHSLRDRRLSPVPRASPGQVGRIIVMASVRMQ